MSYEKILSDIKNKMYSPIYFLSGEESYYIDEISNYIEESILSEIEKEFNQNVLYGRDIDVPTLVSYAKRFPMMANHQVIIVREAQEMKDIENLLNYLEKPLLSTILVICYKYNKIDRRKKFGKVLSTDKNVVLFESPKLYDNKIPDWITSYLQKRNYGISLDACTILADNLGTDLSKIANELQKLIINLPEKTQINRTHIEQNIGISKDFNVFELQKAIGTKNFYKANQIIFYFGANPKNNPLIMVVSVLFSFFQKIIMIHNLKDKTKNNVASVLTVHPFFVQDFMVAANNYSLEKSKQSIRYLREYDLKAKGVGNANTPDSGLMKEMIFKIMH